MSGGKRVPAVMEVRLRPGISGEELQTRARQVRKWLESGARVKVMVIFRGREVSHPEAGLKVLQRVRESLEDAGRVESGPKTEDRRMEIVMAPRGAAPGAAAPVGAKPKVRPPSLSAEAEAKIPKEGADETRME